MSGTPWAIEHSVETAATPSFAWSYMTEVKNWDDPPAEFKLTGSFASGSVGTTEIPGQEPKHWRLRDVEPHHSYTIEIALEGAFILCKWVFAELSHGRTRLTQHITMVGEKSSSYLDDVERAFAPGLATGMKRIATAIDQAYAGNSVDREAES